MVCKLTFFIQAYLPDQLVQKTLHYALILAFLAPQKKIKRKRHLEKHEKGLRLCHFDDWMLINMSLDFCVQMRRTQGATSATPKHHYIFCTYWVRFLQARYCAYGLVQQSLHALKKSPPTKRASQLTIYVTAIRVPYQCHEQMPSNA